MQLSIAHETRCEYSQPVESAHHLSCLQPRVHPGQRLHAHSLDIWPKPLQRSDRLDAWGNPRSHLCLHEAHRCLVVRAHSVVHTSAPSQPAGEQPWEAVAQALRYQRHAPYVAASVWTQGSPLAARSAELAEWARPSFGAQRPLGQAARELMQRLHDEFIYDGSSTEVHTPAQQALAQRRGVCQDFAHVLVAALRSLGLAAQYVSGYLLTQAPPGQARLRGADASHAWAAVYLPPETAQGEPIWLHLDPTNARAGSPSPGQDYVVLALGRDYNDVAPLRGVLRGGGAHRLSVGVTVEPLAAPAAASPTPGPPTMQAFLATGASR